jgi:hypothetical protein
MSFPCLLVKDSQNAHYFMHLMTQVLYLQLLCKAKCIAKIFGVFSCDGICSIAFKAMALWCFSAFRCYGTGIARSLLQCCELRKISRRLKNVTNVFLLISCIICTVQEIQEENYCGRNCNGVGAWQEKAF